MRIVVWGINYAPEPTGIAPFNTGLAEYLAGQGHEVAVVTGFPYYPQWKRAADTRGKFFADERRGNVSVHRCWLYVPGVATTVRRIAHELSFGLVSFFRALALRRADIYVVISPPLVLGFFAWMLTRLKGSRYVFHVQDLQPDAAVGLQMIKGGAFIRALYALERFAYRHAAGVSGISDGMMAAFADKGVPLHRRIYFPNWLRGPDTDGERPLSFRERYGVPADALLAVYAGNLGRKQGIDILLETARLLESREKTDPAARRIRLIIIGSGAGRAELEANLAGAKLENVQLLPLLNDEDYSAMLKESDVGLITQAAGTGQFFFPSKLLSTLRAGLPVITVADEGSELARAVADGGFGQNIPPGRADLLAESLRAVSADPLLRRTWAARTQWVRQFSPALVLPLFQQRLELLVDETRQGPGWPVRQRELSHP
ncbi:WcaI family glycosyltransferase [Horticoccus luteus]|uniref:WcaI family glycosyltransferase n=1 Tax=Horticoccus luteus TaxID=2862869 RepID=A0A8F9TYH4_9BACT|nr:WcaI family glycosyltransferase [Horticoccus luteus]QYM80331.1 WcaI family glycosyltransferase [Horticoccus luteus]